MPQMIFVSLPVTDLKRATAFYEAMGATRNPQFSNDAAACMVFSDAIFVMLTTHAKFLDFSPKPIADARSHAQVLLCLSADSREAVDATIGKAGAAGGKPDVNAPDEYGYMYGRSVEDPDGHLWQVMWMDVEAAQKAQVA